MRTATETMIEQRERENHKRAFEYQIESFLNQWKPQDRKEASQFEAQLVSLVRQVYADAQQPVLNQLANIAMSTPFPFAALK